VGLAGTPPPGGSSQGLQNELSSSDADATRDAGMARERGTRHNFTRQEQPSL
jgi:hypothetical protein